MSLSFDDVGWTTITANDALTGTSYEISYQSFTGNFKINGVNVERTRVFEDPGEETANTLTFQGEGIIAQFRLSDLQRLLH